MRCEPLITIKVQQMKVMTSESSWCKWQKVVSEGTLQDFVHDSPPLSEEVLKLIKRELVLGKFTDKMFRFRNTE